jgi:hypothetical protein
MGAGAQRGLYFQFPLLQLPAISKSNLAFVRRHGLVKRVRPLGVDGDTLAGRNSTVRDWCHSCRQVWNFSGVRAFCRVRCRGCKCGWNFCGGVEIRFVNHKKVAYWWDRIDFILGSNSKLWSWLNSK